MLNSTSANLLPINDSKMMVSVEDFISEATSSLPIPQQKCVGAQDRFDLAVHYLNSKVLCIERFGIQEIGG